MRNHWSCSAFADWLRGTDKLSAGTSEEWEVWKQTAKANYPLRYWLAEEGLDKIQNVIHYIPDKLYAVKYYINNRWVSRTHALTAHARDIPRGQWCDVGYRFLPCLFNELVDFVEIEQAWHHVMWDKEARKKYKTPWWGIGWFRWRTWRCPEAGIEYLKWAMSLKADESWGMKPGDKGYGEPTHQALAAKEILELYAWWKEVYPNRPDPMDASGWTEYCERKRQEGGLFLSETKDPKLKKFGDNALKLSSKIEAEYDREDERQLIRLIKIRKSLWT